MTCCFRYTVQLFNAPFVGPLAASYQVISNVVERTTPLNDRMYMRGAWPGFLLLVRKSNRLHIRRALGRSMTQPRVLAFPGSAKLSRVGLDTSYSCSSATYEHQAAHYDGKIEFTACLG
jgi:hypothetical protein